MEPYDTAFAALIDCDPADLDADERESLNFYYASVNLAEGLSSESPPRRWCKMATTVGRIAHMLGRLPQSGDPGATPQILAWIEDQKHASLNSYQRARLNSFPGGEALI